MSPIRIGVCRAGAGWLVGRIVEFPGCYTHAPNRPSLEANVAEAIAAYAKMTQRDELFPEFTRL